jgi:hypothetical protein
MGGKTMRKTVSYALVLALVVAVAAIAADEPKSMGKTDVKWFDPENCEFCKHLTETPHLMENMKMEYRDVKNGEVSLTTVAPEYRDAYKTANEAMMALGADIESGKRNPMEVKMCGCCQEYGRLLMAGANFEHVQCEGGDILLITSNDEAMIKQIHAYGERNRTEMAKMKAMTEEK